MKTILKVCAILVVAVLIGGLFFGAVNAMSGGSNQVSPSNRPTNGEFNRPDREGGDGGLQLPFDSIKNLLIISAVGVIYLNYPKWLGKTKGVLQPR